MKIEDYTVDELKKIVAEVDYDIAIQGSCLYDICLFTKIFKSGYDYHYIPWFDNNGKFNIGESLPSSLDYEYNKAASVKSVEKIVNSGKAKMFRVSYCNVVLVFGETMLSMHEDFDCDEKHMRLETILSNDTKDYIFSVLGALEHESCEYESNYYFAIKSGSYIMTKSFKSKTEDIDINKNYNDDLPIDKITEILERKKNDLILFYGIPGGGKTFLIRYLVKNINKKFIFIDPSVFDSSSNGMLIDFLDENRNSVIVMEDCEKILCDRHEGNVNIGTMLNLTDGIMGDVMNVKFICTFNCPISEIDKAMLRKGRLSLKYEFKPLPLEKAREIYPDATGEMTLADAYNAAEENDFSKDNKKTIGFGV